MVPGFSFGVRRKSAKARAMHLRNLGRGVRRRVYTDSRTFDQIQSTFGNNSCTGQTALSILVYPRSLKADRDTLKRSVAIINLHIFQPPDPFKKKPISLPENVHSSA